MPRNRESKRGGQLQRRYGITLDDYNRLLVEQGGACAVCRQPETARDPKSHRRISLAVDHDHLTGAVRGLLCSRCNRALGYLQDDPRLLIAAAAYVMRHSTRTSE